MRKIIFVVAAFGLLAPASAWAQAERVWLSITGGGSQYTMTELNREIQAANESSGGDPMWPTIHRGYSFGVAVGYETPSRWNFGIGVERLLAETHASNASGAWKYEFSANAWRGFAEYSLRGIGRSSLRLGAGLGILGGNGKYTETDPSYGSAGPAEYRIGGSAPLYEVYGGGDLWIAPHLAITVASGYRHARLRQVDVGGGLLVGASGEPTPLDYSGPYVRMGAKVVGGTGQ